MSILSQMKMLIACGACDEKYDCNSTDKPLMLEPYEDGTLEPICSSCITKDTNELVLLTYKCDVARVDNERLMTTVKKTVQCWQ